MDVDADTVAPAFACPKCGERRVDWLQLGEDDVVACASCGHRYHAGGEPAGDGVAP